MTAKVAKLGCRIYEVGVSYYGRTWCIVTLKYSVKIWLCQSQLKEEAMAIRYAVDLTDTERAALREIISKNKAKRSTIIHAYILLKADRSCGWTNADIAAAYEVSTKKVEQLKKRFVEEGFEAALYRKPVTK